MNSDHLGTAGAPDAEALSDAMRTAATGVQAPAGLVQGGLARGRRMRAVRRMQIVGASLAVVVAAAGGTLALTAADGGSGPAATVGRQPTVTVASPTAPVPNVPRLSAQQVWEALKPLLPPGSITNVQLHEPVWDDNPHKMQSAAGVSFVFDPDGKGAGEVSFSIKPTSDLAAYECPDYTGTVATCSRADLAGGLLIELRKDREYPVSATTDDGKAGSEGRGAWTHAANLRLANGFGVTMYSTSTPTDKSGTTGRPAAVLTLEQQQAITSAPVWQSLAVPGSLPTRQATPAQGAGNGAVPENVGAPTATTAPSGTGWGSGTGTGKG
ncbi:hypothetical protein [Yinghuangia soli]|uniref:Uncharacterized protein n=1 Tax=Yinghuangia soli TaxID=2908204 RepID=A0AA41PW67_9ACTN|nr:hypothetical protein [Yinghuangia soli]MCF2526311.1 hypothetical protein [Yinghuangia soli]